MSKNLESKNTMTAEETAYFKAERARHEAEAQPSKESEWPLVSFTDEGGARCPVYREEG